jgi:hypothetical protein
VFYIFCPILIEFAADEVQGNLWGPCEYCEDWCYQSHTVVRGINEFLSILPHLLCNLVEIHYKRSSRNTAEHL